MKIAIAADVPDLSAEVGHRLGASQYLIIVNLDSGDFEAVLWAEAIGRDWDLSRWYSQSELNFSGFASEKVDKLLAEANNKRSSKNVSGTAVAGVGTARASRRKQTVMGSLLRACCRRNRDPMIPHHATSPKSHVLGRGVSVSV